MAVGTNGRVNKCEFSHSDRCARVCAFQTRVPWGREAGGMWTASPGASGGRGSAQMRPGAVYLAEPVISWGSIPRSEDT